MIKMVFNVWVCAQALYGLYICDCGINYASFNFIGKASSVLERVALKC